MNNNAKEVALYSISLFLVVVSFVATFVISRFVFTNVEILNVRPENTPYIAFAVSILVVIIFTLLVSMARWEPGLLTFLICIAIFIAVAGLVFVPRIAESIQHNQTLNNEGVSIDKIYPDVSPELDLPYEITVGEPEE